MSAASDIIARMKEEKKSKAAMLIDQLKAQKQPQESTEEIFAQNMANANKPEEPEYAGWNSPEDIKGGGREFFGGLTWGAGDEIEAMARSAFSDKSYKDTLSEIQGEMEQYAKEKPKDALMSSLGGGFMAYSPAKMLKTAGTALKVGKYAPRVAKIISNPTVNNLADNAIVSGISGALTANDDRLAGAGSGAEIGTAIAAGAGAGGKLLNAVTKSRLAQQLTTKVKDEFGNIVEKFTPFGMAAGKKEAPLLSAWYNYIVSNVDPRYRMQVADALEDVGQDLESKTNVFKVGERKRNAQTQRLRRAVARRAGRKKDVIENDIQQQLDEENKRVALRKARRQKVADRMAERAKTESQQTAEDLDRATRRQAIARSFPEGTPKAVIDEALDADSRTAMRTLDDVWSEQGYQMIKDVPDGYKVNQPDLMGNIEGKLTGFKEDYLPEVEALLEDKVFSRINAQGRVSADDLVEARNALATARGNISKLDPSAAGKREALREAQSEIDDLIEDQLSGDAKDAFIRERSKYKNRLDTEEAAMQAQAKGGEFTSEDMLAGYGKRDKKSTMRGQMEDQATIEERIAAKPRLKEEAAQTEQQLKERVSALEEKDKSRLTKAKEKLNAEKKARLAEVDQQAEKYQQRFDELLNYKDTPKGTQQAKDIEKVNDFINKFKGQGDAPISKSLLKYLLALGAATGSSYFIQSDVPRDLAIGAGALSLATGGRRGQRFLAGQTKWQQNVQRMLQKDPATRQALTRMVSRITAQQKAKGE